MKSLWLRGGFPESFLAKNDKASLEWRRAFIKTYLERDVPQLGPRIPAETLRRFWTMLAHEQGSMLNSAKIASALGVSGQTILRYLDLLCDLLLVRRLPPWYVNGSKRLTKAPKVYVRDSGVAHALLGIENSHQLLSHPVAGLSWEGWVIEQLLSVAPSGTEAYYYRSGGGAEVDLILEFPNKKRWFIECKKSLSPVLTRGFHDAAEDLKPVKKIIVYPGEETFPDTKNVQVMSVTAVMEMLRKA